MTLQTIIHALFKIKKNSRGHHIVTRRIIIDRSFLGGIGAKSLIAFFIMLPVIEWFLIFNPWVFELLGIAQAIIFYIVFMSFCMFAVFIMVWVNNKKAKATIAPAWQELLSEYSFDMVDLAARGPYVNLTFMFAQRLDQDALIEEAFTSALKALKDENSSMVTFLEQQKGA